VEGDFKTKLNGVLSFPQSKSRLPFLLPVRYQGGDAGAFDPELDPLMLCTDQEPRAKRIGENLASDCPT
jgi:hypothetical protein